MMDGMNQSHEKELRKATIKYLESVIAYNPAI